MMKTKYLMDFTIIVLMLIYGCGIGSFPGSMERMEALHMIALSDNGGLLVVGCNSSGYIQNANDFPIRVKMIKRARQFGECTRYIRILQPNEKIEHYMNDGFAFYIYTLDGTEIGYVRPYRNDK